jgi:hypothetical protein
VDPVDDDRVCGGAGADRVRGGGEFEAADAGQSEWAATEGRCHLMSATAVVAIIVAVIVVAGLLAGVTMAQRRRRLQRRYGPEYDRLVDQRGSRFRAEAELTRRERRVGRLDIRPLTDEARARYSVQWAGLQEGFVDRPADAVSASRVLVTAVLKERGYPADDRNQVLADLSVDHSSALEHYRAAGQLGESAAVGGASTEDLRQAMIHYRAVFLELLGEPSTVPDPASGCRPASDATADEQLAGCRGDLVSPDEPVAAAGKPEPVAAADQTPAKADAAEPADAAIPIQRMPRG